MKKNERLLSLDVATRHRAVYRQRLVCRVTHSSQQPYSLFHFACSIQAKTLFEGIAAPQENKEEQNLCVLFFLSFFALICHSEHAVEESKKTDEMSHIRST